MWGTADISFDFIDDMTADPVVTALVSTPGGLLKFMAEPEVQGTTLVLRGMHAQDAQANAIGPGNLLVLAQALMERMGFDALVIEGAVRTSGANPGRRPRALRFTRHVRAAAAPAPRTR